MGEFLRKFLAVPVIVAGLGVVFVALSLLLLIRKGNARVLGAKLRIGALIVALEAIAVQGAWTGGSCYEREPPTPKVMISEDLLKADVIHLNLKKSDEITATLQQAYSFYSFQVARETPRNWEMVQSGEVVVVDRPKDTYGVQKVKMTIDPAKVPPGVYELRLLQGDSESSGETMPFVIFQLSVTDE